MIHPQHDAVAEEYRGWYTNSAVEIDLIVHDHWFGFLSERRGPLACRLTLEVDEPRDVERAINEARVLAGPGPLQLRVDDRRRDELIGPAVERCGARSARRVITLALVGEMQGASGPENLFVLPVSPNGFEIYATVKLLAFNDDETLPPIEDITAEAAIRAAESPLADYFVGWLDDRPVGVLGHYRGPDQLTFHLGTRLPYRHLGIAQAMLRHWVQRGQGRQCRSLMINCEEGGRPAAFYQRLGFLDEIHWFHRYELA